MKPNKLLSSHKQSQVRRRYRAELADKTCEKIWKALKRHDMNETVFAALMTRRQAGVYASWTSVAKNLKRMRNGQHVSDEFCANALNLVNKLDENPEIVDRFHPDRVGFVPPRVGQSLESRQHLLASDKSNKGRAYVQRLLRRALKK